MELTIGSSIVLRLARQISGKCSITEAKEMFRKAIPAKVRICYAHGDSPPIFTALVSKSSAIDHAVVAEMLSNPASW